MAEFSLKGRLGVEIVGVLKGCCIESLGGWKPRIIGSRGECFYCGTVFKTIRAGDMSNLSWSGGLNETQKSVEDVVMDCGSIWFCTKKFDSPESVLSWCEHRGITPNVLKAPDEMAFQIDLCKLLDGSERIVWADKGVFAVYGVLEKIDTGDIEDSGDLNSYQGPKSDERYDLEEEEVVDEEDTTTPEEVFEEKGLMAAFDMQLDKLFLRRKG